MPAISQRWSVLSPEPLTLYSGTGDPEGSVTAEVGAVFVRQDGADGPTAYVKTSGSGSTGWEPVAAVPTGGGGGAAISTDTPQPIGTAAAGVDTEASASDHVHAHGNQLGGALHANAVAAGAAGFLTGADKTKIDGLATVATSGSASDLGSGTLPAGRMPALTGDVTTASGAVATTIANDAVTNAKAANMAANSIKGNNTAGSADPVDLTVAQTKTLLAIAAGDVSGLATVATSGSASDLGSGTLPAGRMPALTGDVTTSAGGVATSLASNAVVTAKILDANVTLAKIANIATARILGRTSASSGVVEELTGTQTTAMLDVAAGGLKGLLSNADKLKLDGIAASATANSGLGSSLLLPANWSTGGIVSTKTLTSQSSYALYMGKAFTATAAFKVMWYVPTTAAASITWAEISICTGIFSAGAAATLTNRGFTDISAVVNSTGRKTTSVTTSGISAGDDLWIVFAVNATTMPIPRAGSIADDIQTGAQQVKASQRPQSISATAFAVEGATVLPMWMALALN